MSTCSILFISSRWAPSGATPVVLSAFPNKLLPVGVVTIKSRSCSKTREAKTSLGGSNQHKVTRRGTCESVMVT